MSDFRAQKEAVKDEFFKGKTSGIAAAKKLTKITDDLLIETFVKKQLAKGVAVLAVGGYGREELAPFSDVDLWFLADEKDAQSVRDVLYAFWDMGIKISPAIASEPEAIKSAAEDMTVRTTFLDARFLYGDEKKFAAFKKDFAKLIADDVGGDFIKAKIAEQEALHKKVGFSKYVLEPNIKKTYGGIRDLNYIEWILKYAYGAEKIDSSAAEKIFTKEEIKKFLKIKNFFFTARFFLHFLAGKSDDVLSFESQKKIAPLMGYKSRRGEEDADRLMKHFYLAVREVGYLNAALLASFGDEKKTMKNPLDALYFCLDVLDKKKEITPSDIKQIGRLAKKATALLKDEKSKGVLRKIIVHENNPERALRTLNESGILARIISDFARIYARPQRDIYHVYTVDEHTLKAVGFLRKLMRKKDDDFLQKLCAEVADFDVLKMAVFLHDIGKDGTLGHDKKGAETAYKIACEFGFSDAQSERVKWLVANHLLFTKVAYTRDLKDEKTIRNFAAKIVNTDNLAMLLLLTISDICAVAPNVWSDWKYALFKELYQKAFALLKGEKIKLRNDAYELFSKMKNRAQSEGKDTLFTLETKEEIAASKVVVFAKDRVGLFADIVGAMSVSGASIMAAKINTIDGFALDTFLIQNVPNEYKNDAAFSAFADKEKIQKLEKNMTLALEGKLDVKAKIAALFKKKKPVANEKSPLLKRVLIDNEASAVCSVIDINAVDSKGFLYFIASTLTALGLNIQSAHIATYGAKVVDAFYVSEEGGGKISGKRLDEVKAILYDTLEKLG